MHVECYDSPFHRATESPTDRLIQEVKKRYCGFLTERLSEIKLIEILEVSHPMMSCFISVLLKFQMCEMRVNYDMDAKQFMEPRIMMLNGALTMSDGYLFTKEDLGVKMITIFAKFYETSQLEGCGTRHGGNWDNNNNTNQMARKEYERLKEEHRKRVFKQQEKTEERRYAESVRRITETGSTRPTKLPSVIAQMDNTTHTESKN